VRSEFVGDVLSEAAQTVLEKMFFMMADGDAEPVFAPDTELLRTSMSFSGWRSGTFEVQTPMSCARSIAESFVGADDDMTADGVSEVMCELANMVCGSTLSHLAADRIFDLSAPSSVALPASEYTVTAQRGLMLGDGLVTFAMALEAMP
jgi:CheY-specific phosphatase CheX